ncbi:MAG: AGE family epimerase/isomerase [Dongiaceae bacterium]
MNSAGSAATATWTSLPYHRSWLLNQATSLFDFFEPHTIDPAGGFYLLDDRGRPIVRSAKTGKAPARPLHATARMVHCFAIAQLLGRPGAKRFIDHGMDFLWNGHRDRVHGGYVWSVGKDGPGDDRKQAYGHAFVLLAASSAKVVGHPDADRLLANVSEVLLARFWESEVGAAAEEFEREWSPIGRYRGQNSNMHLTEACMAAFEATGDKSWLDKAESIATLVIGKCAAVLGGRVPEHFNENWEIDRDYVGDEVFRPFGMTPGHWLEWTRLLLQLWETGGRRLSWLTDAAKTLFAHAAAEGWDNAHGGFYYTLDWASRPRLRRRLWWPAAEGIGAAAFLNAVDGSPQYEAWYRRVWDFIADQLIDREFGGWRSEAFDPAEPTAPFFEGRPDLYHALQACLIPLLSTSGSITRTLATTGLGWNAAPALRCGQDAETSVK